MFVQPGRRCKGRRRPFRITMIRTGFYECSCGQKAAIEVEDRDLPDMHCPCGRTVGYKHVVYGKVEAAAPDNAPYCFVKGRDFVYDRSRNIPNIGRFHRSDDAQHRIHKDRWNRAATAAKQRRRDRRRKGDEDWQHVAKVPLEMHESIVENLKDKEAFQKDPETLLKKAGVWFGD